MAKLEDSDVDEVPSDYEDDFEPSLKDTPGTNQPVLDIFPISDYFSDSKPSSKATSAGVFDFAQTPREVVRESDKLSDRLSDSPVESPRELPSPLSPAVLNIPTESARSQTDIETNIQPKAQPIETLPRDVLEKATPIPEDFEEITVLSDSTASSRPASLNRDSTGKTSSKNSAGEFTPIARPRLLSMALSISPVRSNDPLNKRQARIPVLNIRTQTSAAPKQKSKESSLPAKIGTGMAAKTQKDALNKTQILLKKPSTTAAKVSEQKKLVKIILTQPTVTDNDFPDEVPESRQMGFRSRANVPARAADKMVSPQPIVPKRRAKSAVTLKDLSPPRRRDVRPAPVSEEEKAEQEKRYQLLKKQTKERLKAWNAVARKVEVIAKENDMNLESTFTMQPRKELNPIQGRILRERQSSVRIPRFPVKKTSMAVRPATSTQVKRRPVSSSSTFPMPLRSQSTTGRRPTFKFMKGLVDYTVNDSKHSPQTSYHLYLLDHPELLLTDCPSPEHTPEQPNFFEATDKNWNYGFQDTRARTATSLQIYDQVLLTSAKTTAESPYTRRIRYAENIRFRKGLRLQNSRNGSLSLSRSSESASQKQSPVGTIERGATNQEQFDHSYNYIRRGTSSPARYQERVTVPDSAGIADAKTRLKSQVMLKLSAINDFDAENLKMAIADFYDYFRQSKTFQMLSSTDISLILTQVFEELMFI